MITGCRGLRLRDLFQDSEPIHSRHLEIKHNHVRSFLQKTVETLLAILCQGDVLAFVTEEGTEEPSDVRLIIHD